MKKKFSKLFTILFLFLNAIFLSSCWDYVEIERRGYVLGVGVDVPNKEDAEFKKLETTKLEAGVPLYKYTLQIPALPKAEVKPSGQGGGGGGGKKTWNLKLIGASFFEANREFSTRLNYAPFYGHLKVVVLSEEVARGGLYPPLDFLLRDSEMRRRTKVFITPEKASTLLELQPRIDDTSAMYLYTLTKNAYKTSRMLHKTDIGEVAERLHSQRDFVLPRVVPNEDEAKNAGCAVFKKGKMVGWLDELQTTYLKWVADAVKGGTITIDTPESIRKNISLELKKVNTKVAPEIVNGKIKMIVHSKATVNLSEINYPHDKIAFDPNFLKKIEQRAEARVKRQMESTIQFVQEEYGTDIFFFYLAMERYAPDTWDQIKKDWDKIFPEIETQVTVDIRIDQVGLSK